MNLHKLLKYYLDLRGLSKVQLVSGIGYTNMNKGFRRLDEFLDTGVSAGGPLKNIPDFLGIPDWLFETMTEMTRNENLRRRKRETSGGPPKIEMQCKAEAHGFFGKLGLWLQMSRKVPDSILELPFEQEIREVSHLYRQARAKVMATSPPDSMAARITGFRYRRMDTTFEFDESGILVGLC